LVAPGSVLYLFSDGAFEVTTADGRQRGLDDFLMLLGGPEAGTSGETEHIYKAVKAIARPGPLDDDFSVLAVSFD
jgi:sigma-B regulation protein RsbU (phosphoserine phosphatase)